MSLRDKFLIFVEYQRAAEQSQTAEAFQKANEMKQQVLDMIDSLESKSNDS